MGGRGSGRADPWRGHRRPQARGPVGPTQPAEEPASAQRATGSRRRKKTADDAATAPAPAPVAADTPPRGRLPKGALHGLVEDFLAEPQRREHAYTPGEIGRKLTRSQGAVRNALDKLTENGTITLVQTAPHRYQIAETD
jgi:hypothetical protein